MNWAKIGETIALYGAMTVGMAIMIAHIVLVFGISIVHREAKLSWISKTFAPWLTFRKEYQTVLGAHWLQTVQFWSRVALYGWASVLLVFLILFLLRREA